MILHAGPGEVHARSPALSVLDFVVFSYGDVPSRGLNLSVKGDAGYPNPTSAIPELTPGDNGDAWILSTSDAIYFTRTNTGQPARVYRSVVTHTSSPPTFATATAVDEPCATGHSCGIPVVVPDETAMLYASWPSDDGKSPRVLEVRVTKSTSSALASADPKDLISHDELGLAAPTWISDDGCEIIARTLPTQSTFVYGKRTPQ
jgi:hypothetical protein